MTIAEKLTRAKADYDAVYEAGKSQGGGKPTLYGTYVIKENSVNGNEWVSENLAGKGVKAYFYDPRIKEYVNLEIVDFYIGTRDEGLYWITDFDENELRLQTSLYYSSQEWISSVVDIGYGEVEATPLPDAKGRIIIFTEPTVVSQQFYNRIKEIADTSEDIFEEGYDKAYDEFWDTYQNYGKRTVYAYAFTGEGWTLTSFKPKYDIKPTQADYFFAGTTNLTNCDITTILNNCGVTLDTSKCTNFTQFCRYNSPLRIPAIDTKSADNLNSTFYNCSVETIDKIILRDDGTQTITTMFNGKHGRLKNVIFEGIIGCDFNMGIASLLSKVSIISIFNALSTTTNGLTITLSETAVKSAFGSTTSEEWITLSNTRTNWSISLV